MDIWPATYAKQEMKSEAFLKHYVSDKTFPMASICMYINVVASHNTLYGECRMSSIRKVVKEEENIYKNIINFLFEIHEPNEWMSEWERESMRR